VAADAPDPPQLVVFDFDGTLVDSDEALRAAFRANGVDPEGIEMGLPVAAACREAGITVEAYVRAYDTSVVGPYPGVADLLRALPRWAVLSNKHPESALAELRRLGWEPEALMCADAFGWDHKSLVPMLDALGLSGRDVVMVGDSAGDVRCAEEVGARFVWAGWNRRVQDLAPSGEVAATPSALLALLGLR